MKLGLIGNGRIARRHVEAIAEISEIDLVGIVEKDPKRHSGIEHDFQGPFYSSVGELIAEHPDIGLLSVLVESGNHAGVALDLMGLGIPVLVEKPLALSLQDAESMVRHFHEKQIPLFVVKQNRLNAAVSRSLVAIREGEIGRVLTATASVLWSRNADYYLADSWRLERTLDGGVVWNQASHYVDLLVAVLGRVESVFAYGENFLSPARTEDTVFSVFKAESGALGSLQATTTIRPTNFEGSLTVSGETGLIRIGGHALNEISYSTCETLQPGSLDLSSSQATHEVYGKSHSALYRDILRDLNGDVASQFRASKGLHVVAVMEAIERSVLQRREVRIAEIEAEVNKNGKGGSF